MSSVKLPSCCSYYVLANSSPSSSEMPFCPYSVPKQLNLVPRSTRLTAQFSGNFNPFTARVNVGVPEVVLTFESVDNVL